MLGDQQAVVRARQDHSDVGKGLIEKAVEMNLRRILSSLLSRKRTKHTNKRNMNRVDDVANELHRTGRIGQLEAELAGFNVSKLTPDEKEAWYHLRGIVAFQRHDRPVALERFMEGLVACPDSQQIRFALGQEYEHVGNADRMFELFDGCAFPGIPARFALAQARYAYLWNRMNKAIEYIRPIFNAYDELKILDDNFLYMRGLPFFSETWSYLACFLELSADLPGLRQFTLDASKRLSEFPFDKLLTFVDCVSRGDFKRAIGDCQATIVERNKVGVPIPNGYILLHIAMLQAVQETDLDKAEKLIMGVPLSDRDFPWLKDIQLLAQCYLANQRGDAIREEQLQESFIAKQPLLFEPNHVFDFRLVNYQESLKAKYQSGKRAA